MKKLVMTVCLFATTITHAHANCPAKGSGTLDQIVTTWVNKHQPGSAFGMCAVALDGTGAEGFACAGKATATTSLTRNTLFQIGSVTKTMTGTLFAYGLDSGRYTLSTKVDPLLPKYRLGTTVDPVTLLQLATHHGGLPKVPPAYGGADGDFQYYSLEMISWSLLGLPPSTDWVYSNFGYQVLGYLLARHDGYGDDWFADVAHTVLSPLGMNHTAPWEWWEQNDLAFLATNAAEKHDTSGAPLGIGPAGSCPTANPSGCLYSTPHDMRIWLQWNMNLRPGFDSVRSRLRRSYASGQSSTKDQGLAWAFYRDDSTTSCDPLPHPKNGHRDYVRIEKSGDIAGSHAAIVYLQDPDVPNGTSAAGVVVMVNSDTIGPNIEDLAHDLLSTIPLP